MNNLIPSHVQMHEKYDLKGSTYKRRASSEERGKKTPTWKDLDFMERHPQGFLLDVETFKALEKTVQRDCRVSSEDDDQHHRSVLCTIVGVRKFFDYGLLISHRCAQSQCWRQWFNHCKRKISLIGTLSNDFVFSIQDRHSASAQQTPGGGKRRSDNR